MPVPIAVLPEHLYDDAVALWREAGLTRPWNDPHADLRRAAGGPSSAVLGAWTDDDLLLGTVMVGHDGHRGWVYYLAVRPDRRRSGLGRRLMTGAEEWLRNRGVPKLNLMVRRDNESVLGFYEALGYRDADVAVLATWLTKPADDGPTLRP